jgi:hypothetical protein
MGTRRRCAAAACLRAPRANARSCNLEKPNISKGGTAQSTHPFYALFAPSPVFAFVRTHDASLNKLKKSLINTSPHRIERVPPALPLYTLLLPPSCLAAATPECTSGLRQRRAEVRGDIRSRSSPPRRHISLATMYTGSSAVRRVRARGYAHLRPRPSSLGCAAVPTNGADKRDGTAWIAWCGHV